MRLLRVLIASLLLSLPIASSSGVEKSQLIMAFDMSGSMKGDGLAATKRAANNFLSQLPAEISLEIYTFSTQVTQIEPMSNDHARLSRAIDSIESKGETAIYDTVISLGKRASSLDSGLIIFTDGRDSASKTTSENAKAFVTSSKVRIRFVAFQPRQTDLAKLIEIAGINGVIKVDEIEKLSDAFKEAATSVTASEKPIASKPLISLHKEATEGNTRTLPLVFGGGAALLSILVMSSTLGLIRRRSAIEKMGELLESYQVRNLRSGISEQVPKIQSLAERIVQKTIGDYELILPKLAEHRKLIFASSYIALLLLGGIIGLSIIPNLLLTCFASAFVLRSSIQMAEERRRREFENELPNSLKILAASLSSGLSFLQALETFVRDNETQVAYQFRRALSEIQMGAAVETALSGVATRMSNEDLDWTIFAFTIQREVGGSLAKILETSAATIESRSELRREVRTLSAEGRLSSYILMCLPIGIFVFLALTRPSSISIFWKEGIGRAMISVVAIFMALAWVWIRKLVRIST